MVRILGRRERRARSVPVRFKERGEVVAVVRISGRAYVVGDNVTTDQILPSRYYAVTPTGLELCPGAVGHALAGLPQEVYPKRFVQADQALSDYAIVIAGRNFGCGPAPQLAPAALAGAGIRVIIAESFPCRIFSQCMSRVGIYHIECEYRICDAFETGDTVEVSAVAGSIRFAGSVCSYPLRMQKEQRDIRLALYSPVRAKLNGPG